MFPQTSIPLTLARVTAARNGRGLLRFVHPIVSASTSGRGSTRGRTAPAIFSELPSGFFLVKHTCATPNVLSSVFLSSTK